LTIRDNNIPPNIPAVVQNSQILPPTVLLFAEEVRCLVSVLRTRHDYMHPLDLAN
jgi:hypothetical protein